MGCRKILSGSEKMKFETTVQQMKVYLREGIRTALGGVEDGDVLVWIIENQTVSVRKKE